MPEDAVEYDQRVQKETARIERVGRYYMTELDMIQAIKQDREFMTALQEGLNSGEITREMIPEIIRKKLSEIGKAEHRRYLKSPEWKAKRTERLKLDGYRCSICGGAKNLQVHHVDYTNIGTPEEIDDLITICRSCHWKLHKAALEEPIE